MAALCALLAISADASITLSPARGRPLWRSLGLTSQWSFGPPGQSADSANPHLVFRYQPGMLLVGAAVGEAEKSPQYGANHFITDLQRGGVHAAKPEEWDASRPVATHTGSPFRHLPVRNDQLVSYAGRTFRGKGERLDSFALSPDGQWLALMSWQGHVAGGSDFQIDFSITRGQLFVDIYNVSSGAVETRVSGRFFSEEPFETLQSAQWVSDRHFAIAASGTKKLLLCDMRPGEPAIEAAWDLVEPGAEILGFWEEPRLQNFGRFLDLLTLHTAVRVGSGGPYTLKGELFSSNNRFQTEARFTLPKGARTNNPLLNLHEWTALASASASLPPGTQSINVSGSPLAPGPYEFRSLDLTTTGVSVTTAASLGSTQEYPATLEMNALAKQMEPLGQTE